MDDAELTFDLGDGAVVRPVRATDVDEMLALSLANQEHLRPWMPWAADVRRENTEAYVTAAIEQRERDDGVQFVLVVDGALGGALGFHRIDRLHLATTLGYWLAAEHVGRGLATRGVRALVSLAFGPWGLHRVEIDCGVGNARSRAVPERLGFVEEGVRRDGERFGDRYVDLVVYSMLAPDWPG